MTTTTAPPAAFTPAPAVRDDLAVSDREGINPALPTDLPEHPTLHRWTVEEYDRMAELGALDEDLRVELLDGLIVDKMPNNPPHAFPVGYLTQFFVKREEGRWVTRCQLPVPLPEQRSEPEPDVALVRLPATAYRRRHPEPADVFLLVEVADSSLRIDRNLKLSIYVRAGVAEYWILNVPDTLVEIYRDPDPDTGRYCTTLTVHPGETCAPAAFPDALLNVADFLG